MELIWSGRLPVARKSVEGFSCQLRAWRLAFRSEQGVRSLDKTLARASHQAQGSGKPFSSNGGWVLGELKLEGTIAGRRRYAQRMRQGAGEELSGRRRTATESRGQLVYSCLISFPGFLL
jgi:hypothetical protein